MVPSARLISELGATATVDGWLAVKNGAGLMFCEAV